MNLTEMTRAAEAHDRAAKALRAAIEACRAASSFTPAAAAIPEQTPEIEIPVTPKAAGSTGIDRSAVLGALREARGMRATPETRPVLAQLQRDGLAHSRKGWWFKGPNTGNSQADRILAAMRGRGPMTAGDVAAASGVPMGTISGTLGALAPAVERVSEGVWRAREPKKPAAPAGPAPAVAVHALERYRIHYPDAGHAQLLADLSTGQDIAGEVVWQVTQRKGKPDARDRFVLSASLRGCFVVSSKSGPEAVVTYLRFGTSQESWARRNYGTNGHAANGGAA